MRHLCGTAGRTQSFLHAVAQRETSVPSGIHCALLICTEELVSGALAMLQVEESVCFGFWLTHLVGDQVGGKEQAASLEKWSLSSQSAS